MSFFYIFFLFMYTERFFLSYRNSFRMRIVFWTFIWQVNIIRNAFCKHTKKYLSQIDYIPTIHLGLSIVKLFSFFLYHRKNKIYCMYKNIGSFNKYNRIFCMDISFKVKHFFVLVKSINTTLFDDISRIL